MIAALVMVDFQLNKFRQDNIRFLRYTLNSGNSDTGALNTTGYIRDQGYYQRADRTLLLVQTK